MSVALLLSQGRDARLSAFAVTAGGVVMMGAATRVIVDVTFVVECRVLCGIGGASNSGEALDWGYS